MLSKSSSSSQGPPYQWVFLTAVYLVFNVGQLVVGSAFFNDCNSGFPCAVYLIVTAICSLLVGFAREILVSRTSNDAEHKTPLPVIYKVFAAIRFALILLGALSIWYWNPDCGSKSSTPHFYNFVIASYAIDMAANLLILAFVL